MSQTLETKNGLNPPRLCYYAGNMILILFLLFVQLSCGSATGGDVTPTKSVVTVPAPAIIAPTIASTEVPTSGSISVSFSTEMDPTTITARTFQVADSAAMTVSGRLSFAGKTATFTPIAPLMPKAEYTVTVRGTISSSDGRILGSDFTWKFQTGADVIARASQSEIPETLFGMHIHYADNTTEWPVARFSTWRLWDAYVGWPWLEPSKGEWHFEKLDHYLDLAESHNVEVLLPLALTPTWASARPGETVAYAVAGSPAEPANLQDWKDYVRKVATRYKGRIHYYEIWNEADLSYFFTGSISDMVELAKTAYQIIKEIDPAAQVVSPSGTSSNGATWLNHFLHEGGGKYVDIIGYHFYVTPNSPEAMTTLIARVRETLATNHVADKPLWNTESGWSISNRLSTVTGTGTLSRILTESEASAYIARSYILNWASGIDRFCWYSWDNKKMGLVEADGKTIKAPAIAYAETYKWLAGAKLVSCGQNKEGMWVAQLVRENGYRAWVLWSTDKSIEFYLPAEWHARQMRYLSGSRTSLERTDHITVDTSPLIVENWKY